MLLTIEDDVSIVSHGVLCHFSSDICLVAGNVAGMGLEHVTPLLHV